MKTILLILCSPLLAWSATDWGSLVNKEAAYSEQAIVVTPVSKVRVDVRLFEKKDGQWLQRFQYPGVIGHNGFASEGEKREGDRKTPTGTYGFITAWGYKSNPGTRMSFRTVDEADLFIDDVSSPDYNRWVRLPTEARSFEKMKRKDALYEFGLVLDYNSQPVIPGHGSAIFFHVWRTATEGTEGCVAVSRENILQVLKWMDPLKNPKILLNPNFN